MSLDQEVEVLRNIPLFANVESSKLKLMAFASERLTFKEGQRLFKQGERGEAAYVILDGKADVSIDTPEGPLTVATLKRNDIVGEIAVLIDVPRTATVTAGSELVTLKLTKELFLRLMVDFPEIGLQVMRVLAHRLEDTNAQLRRARAKSA